jgi:hypothetical protein
VPFSAIPLRAVLPDLSDATLSLEDQARCVLYLLLDRIEDSEQPQIPFDDPYRCPNCDDRTESLAGPYCSESCRDQAAFVRQFRAALATGSILTPEKQVVFGERLWWLLGGGLPLRESRIPESAKRQVARRSVGKCEICGEPMTTVENFGSGCNRPLHLRAVCSRCSMTKCYRDLEFSQSSRVVKLLSNFAKRIDTAEPMRQCDDPDAWNWREFMAKRRNRGR